MLLCVPQGRDVFANYTGTVLQVSIINSSTYSSNIIYKSTLVPCERRKTDGLVVSVCVLGR
jgi:hypothetical protein